MIVDLTEVRPLDPHKLQLRFEDGVAGEVDLTELVPFEGVFAPLRDPARFAEAYLHPELATVCWPNGADLDPVVLHRHLSKVPA